MSPRHFLAPTAATALSFTFHLSFTLPAHAQQLTTTSSPNNADNTAINAARKSALVDTVYSII